MTGYLSIAAATVVIAVAGSLLRRGHGDPLGARLTYVLLYHGFSVFSFLHFTGIRQPTTYRIDPGALLSRGFQTALAVLALSLLTELWLVVRLKTLFLRMILPATAHALASLAMLFAVGFGIINAAWLLIFTGALCGYVLFSVIFASLAEVIEGVAQVTGTREKEKLLDLVREEMNRFLKVGFQAFLALGASLGVSMSILFGGAAQAWRDRAFLVNAGNLVFGFGLISLGLTIWLVKPYLDNFAVVRYYYEEALGSRRRIML